MSAATVQALPNACELRRLLDVLGRDSGEKLSVCFQGSGPFRSTLTTVDAADDVARPHMDGNVWFGTQALHSRVQRGRGTAKDVVGLRDLTCDLDVKAGGMPDWETARAVVQDLSDMLGVLPVALVYTGHGLQPHWAIERDIDTDWTDEQDPHWSDAVALWQRWGRLVAAVAARRGGKVDSVFDLSRVMRAPGSVNRKDAANPVPVRTEFPPGSPVSLTQLREACDESGIVEHPEDREVLGEVVQPAATWSYGDQTCRYVVGMVTGWADDRPDARHPWLVAQSVRLAAARRLGGITEADHAQAVAALATRFRTLLTQGIVRNESCREVDNALDWGVRRVEAMTDERARQELGFTQTPHQHAPVVGEADFWRERPMLAHIEQYARAHMASPWAVLGAVLCRVLITVPPHVVLPALVGSKASLNTFVCLVGPSGSGKGAAEAAAGDAVDVGAVDIQTAGSGEGLVKLFGHFERGQVVRDRTSVLLSVPEVDNLVALKTRMGATIMPLLRSGWSGEKLGFSYADPTKAVQLDPHTYRLCMLLGVQPGRAEPLLDDAAGGTPQRFIWLPSTDPDAPDITPVAPQTHVLAAQEWPSEDQGLFILPVPQVAVDTIRQAALVRLRGGSKALDGHAMLARLKLSQALTLLDGRRVMTEDDWRLSGVVMQVSDCTRGSVEQHLAEERETANLHRAKADGKRAAVADEVKDEHAIKRISKNVKRHLSDGREVSASHLMRQLVSRDRPLFEQVLDLLDATGAITITPTHRGGRKVRLNEDAR